MTHAISATVESLDRHYEVNVKGAFLCYKYAAQQMIKQRRGGRIIGAFSQTSVAYKFSILTTYGGHRSKHDGWERRYDEPAVERNCVFNGNLLSSAKYGWLCSFKIWDAWYNPECR